jgi:hypothetical protein
LSVGSVIQQTPQKCGSFGFANDPNQPWSR